MRVVNSLLVENNQMLLLYKPSRNKWFLPGGKAEFGEDVVTTGCREFQEETGLTLHNATLQAVTTVVVEEGESYREWLLFTLKSNLSSGKVLNSTHEGVLQWHSVEAVKTLEMFEGDRYIIEQLLAGDKHVITTQMYTKDYDLIELKINK